MANTTLSIIGLLPTPAALGRSAGPPTHRGRPTLRAALLWRAPTGLGLPVVEVLADGTYLSVLIDPEIRGARRRAAIIAAARDGADLADEPAHLVRVIEYDVPDREGNGTGELIVLLSTITIARLAAQHEEITRLRQAADEDARTSITRLPWRNAVIGPC